MKRVITSDITMKKAIYTSRVRERKLEEAGYTFDSYEYDYDAQVRAKNLEKKGYDTKLLREQTDTPGLKMYSVWVREGVIHEEGY